MLHFKAHGRCAQRWFASAEWGRPVCYVEVADDQRATRLVQVFDNGNILSYDRTHWCDDFGQLLGLKFSLKPKWRVFFPDAELIDLGEFESVWSAARKAPLRKEQLARSRLDKWGPYQVSS